MRAVVRVPSALGPWPWAEPGPSSDRPLTSLCRGEWWPRGDRAAEGRQARRLPVAQLRPRRSHLLPELGGEPDQGPHCLRQRDPVHQALPPCHGQSAAARFGSPGPHLAPRPACATSAGHAPWARSPYASAPSSPSGTAPRPSRFPLPAVRICCHHVGLSVWTGRQAPPHCSLGRQAGPAHAAVTRPETGPVLPPYTPPTSPPVSVRAHQVSGRMAAAHQAFSGWPRCPTSPSAHPRTLLQEEKEEKRKERAGRGGRVVGVLRGSGRRRLPLRVGAASALERRAGPARSRENAGRHGAGPGTAAVRPHSAPSAAALRPATAERVVQRPACRAGGCAGAGSVRYPAGLVAGGQAPAGAMGRPGGVSGPCGRGSTRA